VCARPSHGWGWQSCKVSAGGLSSVELNSLTVPFPGGLNEQFGRQMDDGSGGEQRQFSAQPLL
jgi:hypothetical protein